MTIGVEPFTSRWKRRATTVPVMLGGTVIAIVSLPVILAVAAIADLARGSLRFPSVRVALFLVQYAVNDSVEILLAPVLWSAAGFGRRLDGEASIRRHERLQAWSIELLARRAERLLGVRLTLDEAAGVALAPGPVVVLCRHVNLLDASLPSLLYLRRGMRTRGVIMAELLADPGFDLIYGRTGSAFIPRDDGDVARRQIARLASGVDGRTAAVIYPEGRLFRPDALARALARIAASQPARAERLSGLRHVLPPRPGGTIALLDALPGADVVVIAHAGLDGFGSFRELARAVPLRAPIRVTAWRVPAAEVPVEPDDRSAWLDAMWVRVDDWIDATVSPTR